MGLLVGMGCIMMMSGLQEVKGQPIIILTKSFMPHYSFIVQLCTSLEAKLFMCKKF